MQKSNYELTVCVNSRPIREYGHRGLTFVEGRKNQAYTIKFRNNSACRVLAVVSVDGLDVIDGKPATQESPGYIVPAYQSIEVKGWRTSLEKVNEFTFADKAVGYATQTQSTDINSGIVAVKVFAEKATLQDITWWNQIEKHHHHHHYPPPIYEKPWHTYPQNPVIWCGTLNSQGQSATMRCVSNVVTNAGIGSLQGVSVTNADAPSTLCHSVNTMSLAGSQAEASAPQDYPGFHLATGWGKEKTDQVVSADFKRDRELETLEVYYSDNEGLKQAGIDVSKKVAITKPVLPRGFGGFCVPPKVSAK